MTLTQKLAEIRDLSNHSLNARGLEELQKQSISAAFSEIVFRAGNDPKQVPGAMSEIRKELDL